MSVNAIPDGYHAVTPYLSIDGAAQAIDFYVKALGAVELFRMPSPDGKIAHAEIKIGDSHLMVADDCEESPMLTPQAAGGSTVGIMLYVEDVDAVFAAALSAGASEMKPVGDQFYGDRMGVLKDPFGQVWFIATHIEDVEPDELERRAAELFGGV